MSKEQMFNNGEKKKNQGKKQQASNNKKRKKLGLNIYITECTGKIINEHKLRELIKGDGGLRNLETRKSTDGTKGKVEIAYFAKKDQENKEIQNIDQT